MADQSPPPFDDVLRMAQRREEGEAVRVLYHYFERLKRAVGRQLAGKAKAKVDVSGVVQSALFSLVQDARFAGVPLSDVDADGQPMLWPLLLRYLERHCDKWNKFWTAKKRAGGEVPVGPASDDGPAGADPADPRDTDWDDDRLEAACQALEQSLTTEEAGVFQDMVAQKTLDESARRAGCSQAKVSYLRKRIRDLLTR